MTSRVQNQAEKNNCFLMGAWWLQNGQLIKRLKPFFSFGRFKLEANHDKLFTHKALIDKQQNIG
jgi:hypothetical protein